jgi:hypothetical protein
MAAAGSMERPVSRGARQKWGCLVGSDEHGLRPQAQPKNRRMAGIYAAYSRRRDARYQDCRRGNSAANLGASSSCRHTCQSRTVGVTDCRRSPVKQAKQGAEKVVYFVIPSEARNLSAILIGEKRDSSARSVPRNDKMLSFSETCKGDFGGPGWNGHLRASPHAPLHSRRGIAGAKLNN